MAPEFRTRGGRSCPARTRPRVAGGGELVSWVGYDPATFSEPSFWENFPPSLRVFLREVHAGFVTDGRTSFGPMRPVHMQTIAEMAGLDGR